MATSKIKGNGGYKTSSLSSPLSGASLSHNSCWSDGNVVNIGLTISNIDVAANGTVATVPEGYRPVGYAARCIGIAAIDNAYIPVFTTVNSDGSVTIGYSSSKHMTRFEFAATYGTH